jgi:divalent metal cation (Fe/Co/Zn/Cd) transporter
MATAETAAPLVRRAVRLEYFTITWNVLEAIVAIGAGIAAGSIALVGFGFDSSIEGFAATVVLWQLRGAEDEARKQRALKLIAITFFVLAGYVVFESVRDLVTNAEPESSTIGIGVAIVSIIVMPTLGFAKKRLANTMGSAVLRADAAETFPMLVAVGDSARRPRSKCHGGLVVGRPGRSTGDRMARAARGPRGVVGRR